MNPATAQHLIEINHKFYTNFGEQFSATRQRIQPGVRQIMSQLSGTEHILDLGCGNGEFARTLAHVGFQGSYTGLDFSLPLLNAASLQSGSFSVRFFAADLTGPAWHNFLGNTQYSLITAFAFLHHVPDVNLRQSILQKIQLLLEPKGKFIHSNWQFLNSEKLKRRIQPWETINLSATDVDENDYLLDWRSGGSGLRYAHHFSTQELETLAHRTGFQVKETFCSDGENNRLGLYQIWEHYENKG
ncbi:MAG: class I SAM-dependent methyltransferase [Chloroflexota bacterium]